MKKLIVILLVFSCLFSLTSCVQKPENVVKSAFENLIAKDYQKLAKQISTGNYDALTSDECKLFERSFAELLTDCNSEGQAILNPKEITSVYCDYDEKDSIYRFTANLICSDGVNGVDKGIVEKNNGKWQIRVLPFNKDNKETNLNTDSYRYLSQLSSISMSDVLAKREITDALIYSANHKGFEECVPLYEKAIELGSGKAASDLSERYYDMEDYDNCAKYAKKAIEINQDAKAYLHLGILYRFGYSSLGTDIDKAELLFRCCLEKDSNNIMANRLYGELLLDKKDIGGVDYLEKASNLNDGYSQYTLGLLYGNQKPWPWARKDYVKARAYYEKAAANDIAEAYNNLGVLYAKGLGVKRDQAKAYEYYQRAADLGSEVASYNLSPLR